MHNAARRLNLNRSESAMNELAEQIAAEGYDAVLNEATTIEREIAARGFAAVLEELHDLALKARATPALAVALLDAIAEARESGA
jgi:hypothetical protein